MDFARHASSDQSGQEIQSKLTSLKGNKLSPEAKEKRLREACEGFESIFIQNMWKEMRKTVNQTSFLHGKEEQFWQDMYDQELAKKMTSAGGIGLANMMYQQLSNHLTSASKTTANALRSEQNFVPSPAPLMQAAAETGHAGGLDQPLKQASFYEEVASDGPNVVENKAQALPNPANMNDNSQKPLPEAKPNAGEVVDPAIENALAAMRAQVASRGPVNQQLAQVAYTNLQVRQQPAAGGLAMSNAVRRQAGDQLGSRGVREPLLPQTQTARNATENASERREMRQKMRHEQKNPLTPSNQAVFAPMAPQGLQPNMPAPSPVAQNPLPNQNQATLLTPQNFPPIPPVGAAAVTPQNQPEQAAQPQVRKVTYISNKPKRQQQKLGQDIIRTLDLDRKSQQPQGQPVNTASNQIPPTQPKQPTYVQPTAPGALMQPPTPPMQVAGTSQKSDKESAYTIPPLTAGDLRS
ncbi:MAG: rod-binding protein [Desulfovibrionaceae bacterium]|nr:rod-binding protein [Desulfovibrionaceae bacterium]